MRGTFVYNVSATSGYGGRHIFFPIGTAGYGHRKDYEKDHGTAILRYAGSANRIDYWIEHRPLFRNLYINPGAIYWLEKKPETADNPRESEAIAWDFNYYTFDFNLITAPNIFNSKASDACFVRCVE